MTPVIEGAAQAPTSIIPGFLFLVGLAADVIGKLTFLLRVTLLLLGGLALGSTGFELLPQGFLQDWSPAMMSIAPPLVEFLLRHQISVTQYKAAAGDSSLIRKVLYKWAEHIRTVSHATAILKTCRFATTTAGPLIA
jgi:hypothetical protein